MIKKFIAIIKLCRLNRPFLAIPFIFTIAFTSTQQRINKTYLVYILLAVLSGFMAGNIINGMADRDIDAGNLRTAQRPLVKKDISLKECFFLITILILTLFYATYMLNPFYLLLLPIPASLILVYSWLKRFTWLCHICLALINGAVPFATCGIYRGWRDFGCIVAGAVVFFWTIAFEVLYSCQDYEYDIVHGLHSIPTTFGITNAKKISSICYIIMCVMLYFYWHISYGENIFRVGIFIGYLLIIIQQIIFKFRKENIKWVLEYSELFSLLIAISAVLDYYTR